MYGLVLFIGLSLVLASCGKNYSGAERFPLSGKVTFNGEPVDMGSISFIPLAKDQRVSGGVIADGVYSVSEERGANAGKYRVEIRWQKKTGKKFVMARADDGTVFEDDVRSEGLPPEFHSQSTLTADVDAEKTTFDFDLKSDRQAPRNVDSGVPPLYRNR